MRNILRRRKEERGKQLKKEGKDYASMLKPEKVAALRKEIKELNKDMKVFGLPEGPNYLKEISA